MPSKGSDKEKRSTKSKPTKAHEKLRAGGERPERSPGGWQGPPNRYQD